MTTKLSSNLASSPSLLISGAGDLGLRVAELIASQPNSPRIVCETRSTTRHSLLEGLGFRCRVNTDAPELFDRVLICFAPSPSYLQEVKRALAMWNHHGPALLISSTSAFSENNGGLVDESSPTLPSPLTLAEDFVRSQGAHVLRLAGLYDLQSGAHIFWDAQRESPASPDGIINLVHRDDAATAAAKLLSDQRASDLWVLSDGHPLTRAQIAHAWARFKNKAPCQFKGPASAPLGKKICATKIYKDLAWQPLHTSFIDFLDKSAALSSTRSI